jgi:hypothetical protein
VDGRTQNLCALRLAGVRDSLHWEANSVNVTESGYLSCWVEGLPENADPGNLRLWLGEARMAIEFVGEPVEGRRQINARAPQDCPKGEVPLRIECGGVDSEPVRVRVI